LGSSGLFPRKKIGAKRPKTADMGSPAADRYTTGTGSASLRRQRGEDVNVKKAAATAAAVIGTLILAVAVGVGYLAGHSTSSARTGVATIAHAVASTHGATAGTAAPVKAALDDQIYGGRLNVSIYADGVGVSGGTTTGSGDSGTGGGVTVGVTDSGGTTTGTVTAAIYGD
jgi:hypothetical protein